MAEIMVALSSDDQTISVPLATVFGTGIARIEQTVASDDPEIPNEITCTLTNGQQSKFYIKNGKDGYSPSITIEQGAEGYSITVTDEEGSHEYSIIVDSTLDAESANPIQNQAVATAISNLLTAVGAETNRATAEEASIRLAIPSKTSQLQNDSGYITNAPVASVNGKTGAVNLTASDVGALPSSTAIPSKTSDLTNDSHYITASEAPVQSVNGQTGAVTIPTATTSADGLMSSQDKASLDAVRGQVGDLQDEINNFTLTKAGENINNVGYEGGYIASNGTDTTSSSYETVAFRSADYIPVEGGKTLYWWGYLTDGIALGANAVIVEYDSTKTLIGTRNAFDKYGTSGSSQAFTLSENAAYVRIALYQAVADFDTIKIAIYYEGDEKASYVPYSKTKVIDYDKISNTDGETLDSIIDEKFNSSGYTPLYEKYEITEECLIGALMSNGNIRQTSDVYRYNIPVNKGEKLLITAQHGYAYRAWLFTDSNGNVLSYYPATTSGTAIHTNVEQIAPEDGYLVLQRVYGYNPLLCKIGDYAFNDHLYQKKLYFNGDSIAYGAGGTPYAVQIANKHAMQYVNDAVSGTRLSTRSGSTNSIYERIIALTSDADYDYICVEGGFNDYFSSVSIGTLMANYTDTPDTTTVIGAVEGICKHIRNTLPDKKFFFVLGHRPIAVGAYPTEVDTYWNAIISALEKWAVPYVDIRKEGALMAYNSDWLSTYFATGETMGTHPNELGYKMFYVPIVESKMKAI